MRYKMFACLFVVLLIMNSCSGLTESHDEPETEQILMYPNHDLYCMIQAAVDKPALDDFRFSLPVFVEAEHECSSVSDLRFFYQGKEIIFDRMDNLRLAYVPNWESKLTNIRRYEIWTSLYLSNLTDTLMIDRISAKIDGVDYSFNTDMSITYMYIQPEYKFINKSTRLGQISTKDYVETRYIITPNNADNGMEITSYHSALSDRSPVVSAQLVKDEGGEPCSLLNTPLLETVSYEILFHTERETGVSLPFASSNLFFTIQGNGETLEMCTDMNQIQWCQDDLDYILELIPAEK